MEISKLIILLCCTLSSMASNTHNIPVEDYKTELQDLGQHVEYPETPVRVIKITKTIAVKVPVPYPVKVIEKVPYPVHVSKPYPVPVPQIVKVPAPAHGHEPAHETHEGHELPQGYHVQESGPQQNEGHSFGPSFDIHAFGGGGDSGHGGHGTSGQAAHGGDDGYGHGGGGADHYEGPTGGSFGAPQGHFGISDEHGDNGSFESKSYDKAISEYLQKHGIGGNSGHGEYH